MGKIAGKWFKRSMKKQSDWIAFILILGVIIGGAVLIDYRFEKSRESVEDLQKEVKNLQFELRSRNNDVLYFLWKMRKSLYDLDKQDEELDMRLMEIEDHLSNQLEDRRNYY